MAESGLDEARQSKAREYAKVRRRLSSLDFALSAIVIIALAFTSLSSTVAKTFALPEPLKAAAFFIAIILAYSVVTLPLDYYRGFILSRRYGLSNQSLGSWFSDVVKSLTLSVVLGGVAIIVAYWLIGQFGGYWWLPAWALAITVSLVVSVLAPVLVIPFFFPMKPFPQNELRARLEKLVARAGVPVSGIYLIEFAAKTNAANAAFMGAGRTRRIVLSDTLMQQYSPEEIELIMSHEIGHQKHGDLFRLFGLQAAILLITFGVAALIYGFLVDYRVLELASAAALPLLFLSFAAPGVVLMPVISIFSRRLEMEADGYALELSGDPETFKTVMAKLTDQNLGEASPSGFFDRLTSDHPSYIDRVKMAEEYCARLKPKS